MGSATINLPTIHLDTTLTDLYKLADPSTAHLRLGFVLCGVNSAIALTPSFPRNKKYLYQDSPFNNIPPAELKDAAASLTITELQRSIALKYLSLIPQRDAFITGGPHTPTIFFNVSPGSALQEAHDRHEAEATIAVLSPEQRPKLVFCSGPAEIPVKELGIDRLAVKVMLDDLERKGYPLVVNQETQWFLNSKAGLAKSGLPTPRAEVVDVEGLVPPLAGGECCEVCRAEDDVVGKGGMRFVPAGCKGARGRWVGEQMKRIVEKVDARQVPFVFKTQQTFGGAGTWVVSDEEKKRELVKKLMDDETGVLRKLLSQVTAKNQQMKPGSVVLSEMVRDPVGDYGVTFLVRKGGEATFLAASEQMINEDNAWIGSTINYARQERLKEKFEGIMRQTAEWVGKHGYIGPVGIDVLETKDIPKDELVQGNGISSADGEKTAQYIVDLNVRTSGSLALPLLKGHFTSRGMTCASSFSTTLRGSRKQFMETWREEFETGRMLIMAWYEDNTGNEEKEVESIGDVVVGGKDEKDLQDLMKRVRESTEEVTF
ncbi:hypothetical protein NEUTE1DRAFT_73672 [Neurospora tetrasperma FGSC 2508]|uniref:ATP-grasp domain-containing protein n=1 Tax=Neurospora tetrasperma (strain FGSC 2508 / ATCC MYA-4615 / P0657) TaxID=510951 RepID=F8N213_NEUT8|nr:uncharacterized protein NEUTE1DRAFT_73672 [Neurospora tetrasperma FGSC 2508]EGO53237.1 hypothetical protein NEUTE1DRAFT_73672 [Neurospora tetrasperma FGSC 2508]